MLALILFAVVEEDVDESAAAAVEDMEVLITLVEAAVAEEAAGVVHANVGQKRLNSNILRRFFYRSYASTFT